MKKFFAAALLGFASSVGFTPISAFDVSSDETLCPIETIGDAEIDSWSASLAESKGAMSEAQAAILGTSVRTCAQKLGWSEKDMVSAFTFNLSVIGSTALSEKLFDAGIDAVDYEVVLDDLTAEQLREVLSETENSPVWDMLTEKLIDDFGEKLTDETTADVATYIAFTAQARISSMEMLKLVE